ncbi:MAG: hypothetical protein M3250_01940 [Thermoproteota archaeon]|jgi:hypothetical protein|nr:hypothetical protein [Thermoproteota archaeon]
MIQKQTAIPIDKAKYGARENTILAEKGNRCNNNDNSLVLIDGEDDEEDLVINYCFQPIL